MRWKISDFIALLIALFVSLNMITAILFLSRKRLEKKMNMGYVSRFLKIVLIFSFFCMPVLTGILLYKFVFVKRTYLVSDDFRYLDTIRKISISYGTSWGNHWFFLVPALIWFLGFVYCGIFKYTKDGRLLRKLEKCSKREQEGLLMDIKTEIMKELGLKEPILLLSNDIISSPFMSGIRKRKIFLPRKTYTQEEWELLLKHELVHFKNHDFFFRRLLYFLCSMYWFNPLIYRLSDYFIEVNEMACDEAVLYCRPVRSRALYAELILRTQEEKSGLAAVSLTGHTVTGLERRIRNIMKKTEITRRKSFVLLLAGMLLLCSFTVYAASWSVADLQDLAVRKLWYTDVEEQQNADGMPERTDFSHSGEERKATIQINPKGVTRIDETIGGNGVKYGDVLSLVSGNKVAFTIQSDKDSDCFRAGLVDEEGERVYVQTSDGWIQHTFSISQPGSYTIFFENITSESIHITGSVTVFN